MEPVCYRCYLKVAAVNLAAQLQGKYVACGAAPLRVESEFEFFARPVSPLVVFGSVRGIEVDVFIQTINWIQLRFVRIKSDMK